MPDWCLVDNFGSQVTPEQEKKKATARPKKDLSGHMWGDRAKGKHEGASGI